jgi:uncharacterized OB-fold protein
MQSLKPHLYTDTSAHEGARPQLKGGRCQCGYVFFPYQVYGCEKCGATGDALAPVLLDGAGQLVASARVLIHHSPARKPPFVVASVKLDAGPVVRALLAHDTTETLPVGKRMNACLVETAQGEAGTPLGELRFAPAL